MRVLRKRYLLKIKNNSFKEFETVIIYSVSLDEKEEAAHSILTYSLTKPFFEVARYYDENDKA